MDFKRNSVIALYLGGKSQTAIVNQLKHLKVNRTFVYRTINRYNDTGSIAKRYGGGPKKTATTPEMVRKVKKRLERNPRRSGRQMAKELNISQDSIRRILKNELHVKPYKLQKAHDHTPRQKKVRLNAKQLLRLDERGRGRPPKRPNIAKTTGGEDNVMNGVGDSSATAKKGKTAKQIPTTGKGRGLPKNPPKSDEDDKEEEENDEEEGDDDDDDD